MLGKLSLHLNNAKYLSELTSPTQTRQNWKKKKRKENLNAEQAVDDAFCWKDKKLKSNINLDIYKLVNVLCLGMCVCVSVCEPHQSRYQQDSEEVVGSPGAESMGSGELYNVVFGNQIKVLWKS